MDRAHPSGRGIANPTHKQWVIVSVVTRHDKCPQWEEMSWLGQSRPIRTLQRLKKRKPSVLPPFDWVYLTKRATDSQSQVPFSPRSFVRSPHSFWPLPLGFLAVASLSFRAPSTLGLFRFHRAIKRTAETLSSRKARPVAAS